MLKTQTGKASLYSKHDDQVNQSGVALALDKESVKCLENSDCVVITHFYSQCIEITIIPVYEPSNKTDEEAKDGFYDQLQKVTDNVPKHDTLIIMGDRNAKTEERRDGEERVIGKEVL